MINIHDKAHELASNVRQLEEVKKLKELTSKINQNEQSKEMLKELREIQFLIFNEQRSKNTISEENQKKFREVSEKVMKDPIVSEYVGYEQKVGIIIDDIMKILNEAFGIESFM